MARAPSSRARNLAVLVPLIGLFTLMPPFISLFTAPLTVFGLPLVVVYLFGVWAALIVFTALLARRLASTDDDAAAAEAAPATPSPDASPAE
jgi:hypothetical protein